MTHFSKLLLLICAVIISCNSIQQNHVLSVSEFTHIYYDSLSGRYPVKFKIVNERTIGAADTAIKISISVDNAYKDYMLSPDSLQSILKRYLNASNGAINFSKGEIKIDRIIPLIKPADYLDMSNLQAAEMGATKKIDAAYEKYNEQLLIVYAEDENDNIRHLLASDIKKLNIPQDSLRPIAIRNLDKMLTSIERHGENGVYMITAGGNYEVSIILLSDIFNKETLPVKGDFVIAIPTRDVLLVTGSNDKEGIERIKEAAEKGYETGSYAISKFLYRWNGKFFEKYN
jgi:uncharacterized protein YtpQ (UPF0354 family)